MTIPNNAQNTVNADTVPSETRQQFETRELDRIIQSLEHAFPNVRTRIIQHAVDQAHREFADSPIRDFVPVLVERAARQALIRQTGQLPTHTHISQRIGGTTSATDSPVDPSR